MKVLQITIFVVIFAQGILGQYDDQRTTFNAPKSIERGFAPVNSYFEKDSSSSSSYENPSYGHPNSNYQQPPQILFMPQAQALTAEPPQYGQPQVPEAISNYLATVAQKYGGQNFQDPTKQGPQVFIPPQMPRQSPFQAPDQYQFVPPDLQSFQQPTHQYQQAPVQFNQPEFANIQPAMPQFPQAQYQNHQSQYQNQQSQNQQSQSQTQQPQFQNHQQSQYQNSQSLYLNQQPNLAQYQNQQPQYPNHQPQYSQEQSQSIQMPYQRPENLGHLPPITKNPNDVVNSDMYSENRAPPTKYVKGAHFVDVGNLGEYNEFGNDFEGGYNHFGGFNGFESGKYGGFDGGKFGSFSSFDNSFEDIPSSALTSFKLGTSKPKGNLKLSGSVGSSKRNRYNRGGSIGGIRRPTRFVLS